MNVSGASGPVHLRDRESEEDFSKSKDFEGPGTAKIKILITSELQNYNLTCQQPLYVLVQNQEVRSLTFDVGSVD